MSFFVNDKALNSLASWMTSLTESGAAFVKDHEVIVYSVVVRSLHVVFDRASIESPTPNNNKVTAESYSGIVPTKCVSWKPIALRVRI